MVQDLNSILQAWEFDPETNMRKIWGDDGVQKIQVRIDQGAFQGVLQVNLDGRPDGKKPHGCEFLLDYHSQALEAHRQANGGATTGFLLDHAACQELFDEGTRIYGRYIFLLQIRDYSRVIRDTERNMRLFRFVNTHGEQEDDRMNLEKWWPYILRINATARAKQACEKQDYDQALELVEEAREKIADLPEVNTEEFFAELQRSQQVLDELEEEIRSDRPLSPEETLETKLQKAIEREEFEKAVVLRDELNRLREQS